MFETRDPLGRTVRLTENTWSRHILNKETGHPEFEGLIHIVKATVETPHLIVASSRRSTSDVYFRKGAHPMYPHLFVKVPVDFRGAIGYVSTAMLQKNETQGTDPGGVRYDDRHS